MNDKRASRTRKFLEADAIAKAEGNNDMSTLARTWRSSGVCVAGMLEKVQPRNLGDPAIPQRGRLNRNRMQGRADGSQEVGLLHTTEEVG